MHFKLRLRLLVAVLMVFSSCGSSNDGSENHSDQNPSSPIQAISITGTGSFADGTQVASENVQYQLVLDGANLFQAGVDGCLPTPAHVAGITTENINSNAQGQYSLSVPIHALQAAVVRQCSLENLQPTQIEGLTLKASILANQATCPTYCSAQGDPSSDCVDNCAAGNRTLIASQSLNAQQVTSAIQNKTITLAQNMTFNGLGPALDAGPGPDLLVDGDAAKTSAHVSQESFDASSCEVAEACVRAPGARTVLRFDGTIENLGSADLMIGSPENSGLFTLSSCHNVELLKNIMLYELVNPQTGQDVQVDDQDIIGRKQGFCMMDITQINGTAPQGRYNCENQGITRGWADVYDSALECQFLDITGVAPGNYILKLTVNPDGLFQESDTTNNTSEIPVTIPNYPN